MIFNIEPFFYVLYIWFLPPYEVSTKTTAFFDYGQKLDTLISWFHNNSLPSSITHVESVNLSADAGLQCKLFPNPIHDEISIHSNQIIHRIQVFDLRGNCLKTELVDNRFYSGNWSELQPGVYFVKLLGYHYTHWEKIIVK